MAARQPAPKVTTSGGSDRPARTLRPVALDLRREADALFDEPEWLDGDRNSRTLTATDRLRVTLTALRRGAELGPAETDDVLTIQVLRGALELDVDGAQISLDDGQLASIDHPTAWRARATSDSILLLTVALAD
jgi:quercetin dioxygenase-like cupin family protein